MRALVTGGAGFVGSHVVEALRARGDDVVAVDAFDPYYDPELKWRNLAELSVRDGPVLEEVDLRDAIGLAGVFDRHPIDVVVHLAARAGIRASMRDPGTYVEINLVGTANLLEAMRRSGCERLVFASSSSVYGCRDEVPFRESDPVAPISVYGWTKAAGEDLGRIHAAALGFRVACLRYFTVYGPRQRPEMAIHRFTRALLAGDPLTVFGDGSMERDFTFVEDIARGTLAAIDRVGGQDGFEVFNLGSGRPPVSLAELVCVLGRVAGREPVVERRPAPAVDVPRTAADVSKARRLLGYEPRIGLEEGLRRFVGWYVATRDREPVARVGAA